MITPYSYKLKYQGKNEPLPPDFRDEIKESEQIILGQILWEPNLLHTAKMKLALNDFRLERHKIIFRAMINLSEKSIPVNLLNLFEHLSETGEIEIVGGTSYLTYLPQIVIEERVKNDERETEKILKLI